MATAPPPGSAALLAYFDQTHFKDQGRTLTAFLNQITTDPTVAGGALTFTDVVLNPVPTWVNTVPTGATAAYDVIFTVLLNKAPNDRHHFIVYAIGSGPWLFLGNQQIAKVIFSAFEGKNAGQMCSGINFDIKDKGGTSGISYAVVKGPGLPSAGILLFNDGSTESFRVAAGDPSTYNGTATPQVPNSCN